MTIAHSEPGITIHDYLGGEESFYVAEIEGIPPNAYDIRGRDLIEVLERARALKSAFEKYATVQRDGYTVPLIGIPPEATTEKCDKCGETIGLSQGQVSGTQILCVKCGREK